jgi:phosphoesterase RecJ-like protein
VTSEVTIDQWTAAARAIDSAERILLVAHVTPDADALGSALALGLALTDQGKQIQVSVGEEGFTVPTSLGFLPGVHLVVSPEHVVSPDLVISCDTSSVERLGVLSSVLREAPMSIAIDHHASFSGFGQIHIVDPDAAATAEIVMQMLDRLGVELTVDVASCLYAGLVTDTGSFKFQGATGDTLRLGARLYDAGIDHSRLARLLFDDEPYDAITMMGQALSSAVFNADAVAGLGLVYTSIGQDDRGTLPELAMERVIEVLRRTSEAEVAAVFKQADDGIWKGSLRSKAIVNVGAVATSLGGGGHRFAAGFTGSNDFDAVLQSLLDQLVNPPKV